MKIVLLGAGNVGHHLALALKQKGARLVQIFNRTKEAAVELSELTNGTPYTTDYSEINKDADLYIIAVKDDAIIEVAANLSKAIGRSIWVAHTSGATSIEVLAPFFDHYASFYPLQTFSKEVYVDFEKVPICLTANEKNGLIFLKKLSNDLGCPSYDISNEQRKVLHLASVIACNFTNYLLGASKALLEEVALPYEIIHPLVNETIKKALIHNPKDVQTGPAIRGDRKTIAGHLELLKDRPDLMKIYSLISEGIQK